MCTGSFRINWGCLSIAVNPAELRSPQSPVPSPVSPIEKLWPLLYMVKLESFSGITSGSCINNLAAESGTRLVHAYDFAQYPHQSHADHTSSYPRQMAPCLVVQFERLFLVQARLQTDSYTVLAGLQAMLPNYGIPKMRVTLSLLTNYLKGSHISKASGPSHSRWT